ncbi:DUF418 domain-containing protein [Streptomyces paradoxus]|uniref:DUF418 domain-containing protein n=1 Tax=Streptomyces paradoxus TaxID=66375 RepID=UPI00381419E0
MTGDGTTVNAMSQRTPQAGRVAAVDVLRGFALFGILMVNVTYLASAYHGTGVEDPDFDHLPDDAVRAVVAVFFEAKFFLLFSFLFGYSFTLQLASATRLRARFTPRFLRRLAGLFALGVVHAVMLFPGDILTTYAVLGLILLALRRVRPPTAVRTAVALLVLTSATYTLLALALWPVGGRADEVAAAAHAATATDALRGDAASVIAAHLAQLPDIVFLLVFFQAPSALAAFLLGLAAGKRQALTGLTSRGRLLPRLQSWGFTVGVAGGVVYAHASLTHPGTAYQVLALGIDVVTAPLLATAYAITVLRLAGGRRAGTVAAVLAPAGRMALTNYLTQSLVCALLFTGYGAGLVGRVPPAGVTAIALSLFACQVMASRWWLGRHPYGPVEWGLRAWTTLSRPPWTTGDR